MVGVWGLCLLGATFRGRAGQLKLTAGGDRLPRAPLMSCRSMHCRLCSMLPARAHPAPISSGKRSALIFTIAVVLHVSSVWSLNSEVVLGFGQSLQEWMPASALVLANLR